MTNQGQIKYLVYSILLNQLIDGKLFYVRKVTATLSRLQETCSSWQVKKGDNANDRRQ